MTVPRSVLVWVGAAGLGLRPHGDAGGCHLLGDSHRGESRPRPGVLVMPPLVTLLMAMSHPGITPSRAGGEVPSPGTLLCWPVSGAAAWSPSAWHHGPLRGWDRGPRCCPGPEEGDTVLRCLAGMPSWEAGD